MLLSGFVGLGIFLRHDYTQFAQPICIIESRDKYQSLEPLVGAVEGGIHDAQAEAYNSPVEYWRQQEPHVVEGHVNVIVPDVLLAVAPLLEVRLRNLDASLDGGQD